MNSLENLIKFLLWNGICFILRRYNLLDLFISIQVFIQSVCHSNAKESEQYGFWIITTILLQNTICIDHESPLTLIEICLALINQATYLLVRMLLTKLSVHRHIFLLPNGISEIWTIEFRLICNYCSLASAWVGLGWMSYRFLRPNGEYFPNEHELE